MKKNRPTTPRRQKNTTLPMMVAKVPGVVWVLLLVTFILVALVFAVNFYRISSNPKVEVSDETIIEDFEFYDELLTPSQAPPESLSSPATKKYWVQIASFQDADQAQLMLAELLLEGFPARLEQVENQTGAWHRLRSGPYNSISRLNKARKKLRKKGYSVLVIQQTVTPNNVR